MEDPDWQRSWVGGVAVCLCPGMSVWAVNVWQSSDLWHFCFGMHYSYAT